MLLTYLRSRRITRSSLNCLSDVLVLYIDGELMSSCEEMVVYVFKGARDNTEKKSLYIRSMLQ